MRDLTANRLREALHYNAETGVFVWRIDASISTRIGCVAGTVDGRGYIRIGIDGRVFRAHRMAWLYVYGCWPKNEIDHIDGDTSNNAISNLRDVPRRINQQNQTAAFKNNEAAVRGVSLHKATGKWRARIWHEGRSHALGLFDLQADASEAYVSAKRAMHEGAAHV